MTTATTALTHRLAVAVAESPGCRTSDYVRLTRGERKTVQRTLQKLRAYGYLRSESVSNTAQTIVTWWITEGGQAALDSGAPITLANRDGPDEHWESRPWIHPIRARALGLAR
jgi:DNA-binding IclR family transcriptional regulator